MHQAFLLKILIGPGFLPTLPTAGLTGADLEGIIVLSRPREPFGRRDRSGPPGPDRTHEPRRLFRSTPSVKRGQTIVEDVQDDA